MEHKHKRRIRILAITVGAVLVLLIALLLLLRSPPVLILTPQVPPQCPGALAYNVELRAGLDGVSNARVSIYANDVLLERLRTDQNGRFSSAKPIPAGWCGKPIRLRAVYDGGLLNAATSDEVSLLAKIPTRLEPSFPETVEQGAQAIISAQLLLANGTPLAGKSIAFSSPSLNETIDSIRTDSQGTAAAGFIFDLLRPTTIVANFAGDDEYEATQTDVKTVTVRQRSCSDGTLVNTCSMTIGYLCDNKKQLVFDCARCGCSSGQVCYQNACITQEQKNANLIAGLQKSVVLVGYANPDGSGVSGSGVVLSQTNGETIILTNRHVVNDAPNVAAVKVLTSEKQQATAASIRIAPSGMDLAVIALSGTYGTPATINYSLQYQQGQDVVVLGSPGGLFGDLLQGSVAKGIISNFETQQVYFGNSTYTYNAIQTDAAINHGNSGGGLFLLSNGDLIGINTLGGASDLKQGINFAIDIKELNRLPDYNSWPTFTPTPRCSDGTAYNQCSTSHPSYTCSAGTLVPSCKTCGCGSAYPYCQSSGVCFACNTGYTPYETPSGQGFCCPSGTQGRTDGSCA